MPKTVKSLVNYHYLYFIELLDVEGCVTCHRISFLFSNFAFTDGLDVATAFDLQVIYGLQCTV